MSMFKNPGAMQKMGALHSMGGHLGAPAAHGPMPAPHPMPMPGAGGPPPMAGPQANPTMHGPAAGPNPMAAQLLQQMLLQHRLKTLQGLPQ